MNDHHKHLTTLPHTRHTNAASADLNPLLALGKSVRVVMNQNVKSVINVANLTVGVNVKVVNDTVCMKDTASRIASANAKRNAASAEKRKRLFTTTVANALSSKYVLANSNITVVCTDIQLSKLIDAICTFALHIQSRIVFIEIYLV
jgi:hypothetical protein